MPTIDNPTCQDCRQRRAASYGAKRCAACQDKFQKQADYYRGRKSSNKFEKSVVWQHRSRKVRRDNPICQKINGGVRCTRPSTVVHHKIGPDQAPELRLDPRNLVALCSACHNPTVAGDAGGERYAPTVVNVCGVRTEYQHGTATASPDAPAPGSIAAALASIR